MRSAYGSVRIKGAVWVAFSINDLNGNFKHFAVLPCYE